MSVLKPNPINFAPFIIGTMRLGAWGANLSTKELEYLIDACVEMELIDFDHADIYGGFKTEIAFGEVMKRRTDLSKKVRITTKSGIKLTSENRPAYKIKSYDSTSNHIISSAEQSLKALSVEAIDVLLLHRPDYLMDPSEIAEAFRILKESGKVKAFGVSNFSVSQFDLLNSFVSLETHQVEISLLHRDVFKDGTLDQCLKLGVTPTAWSPFKGGAIFSDNSNPDIQRIKKVFAELVEKYGCGREEIALAWLRKHPSGIIPILGTSKVERIKAVVESMAVELSHEDWYRLWEAAEGKEVA